MGDGTRTLSNNPSPLDHHLWGPGPHNAHVFTIGYKVTHKHSQHWLLTHSHTSRRPRCSDACRMSLGARLARDLRAPGPPTTTTLTTPPPPAPPAPRSAVQPYINGTFPSLVFFLEKYVSSNSAPFSYPTSSIMGS